MLLMTLIFFRVPGLYCGRPWCLWMIFVGTPISLLGRPLHIFHTSYISQFLLTVVPTLWVLLMTTRMPLNLKLWTMTTSTLINYSYIYMWLWSMKFFPYYGDPGSYTSNLLWRPSVVSAARSVHCSISWNSSPCFRTAIEFSAAVFFTLRIVYTLPMPLLGWPFLASSLSYLPPPPATVLSRTSILGFPYVADQADPTLKPTALLLSLLVQLLAIHARSPLIPSSFLMSWVELALVTLSWGFGWHNLAWSLVWETFESDLIFLRRTHICHRYRLWGSKIHAFISASWTQ